MLAKLKPHSSCLLLIPAVLSLFWPTLLDPASVLFPTFSPFSDVMVIHWPKARLMAESWQSGQGLPYWNPLILSGMPLAANQLAMIFYPPAWLFLCLPPEPVVNFLFVFHLVLAGLGIYLLLHEGYNLSALPALLGGLTFALSGKLLAHAAGGHVSLVGAIAWLPWTVFGWRMWLEKTGDAKPTMWQIPCSGWIGLVAVSLAMQIFTHTLPVIYSVYLLVAMTIWHTASQPATQLDENDPNITHYASRITYHLSRFIRSFIHTLIPLGASLILAGLLGAVQLLPLLELAQWSNRSLSLAQATEFALSPAQLLIGLLLPTAQAGHEYVIYGGLVSLLLASFGLSRQNRWTWFYGFLFIFAVLFALGPQNPLHSLFYYAVPGFRWVRTPARIFLVAALAVAVLAGFGAERLLHATWSPPAKKWLTRLTIALAPLTLLAGLGLAFSSGQANPIYRSALALAIFIPAGLSLILLQARQVIAARLAVPLLGVLLFLDLAWFDGSLLRFMPLDEALSPGRAAAEYLAQKPGYFRVYSPSYSLPMQTAAAAGLALADGVEPVHLAVYDRYMARAGGYNDAGFSVTIPPFGAGPLETSLKEVEPNLKLLGLLNVTYLVAAFPMAWPGLTLETEIEGTHIYRNEQALPRAWVVHQTVPGEADWLGQLEAMPGLANVAVVESHQLEPSTLRAEPRDEALNLQPSTAEITYYSPNRIEVEAEISQPGWLILSEIWYPGWRATVNGSPQPVEKVDGLLRGVYLAQPGQYHLKLEYRPGSAVWGKGITGLTASLVVLTAGLRLIKSFRQKGKIG